MIGQYLLNKNESVTVPKTKMFSELNKALVHLEIQKLFKILRHIKCCDKCMKH